MLTPFKSIIDEPAYTRLEAGAKSPGNQQPIGDDAREANAKVTALPTDINKYLSPTVDVTTLPIPLVKFPAVKRVVPEREWTCKGLLELADEIAPMPAPVFARKDEVPYYIAGSLKDAELTNKRLRQERQRGGRSTVGRQRSSAHLGSLGPALLLDDDVDAFARLPLLRVLGVAAIVYSSYSYGFPKNGAVQPSASGRVVLPLNRVVTLSEYSDVWDGANDLLGGGFDVHGRSPAQCYGRHARRAEDAPYRREVLDGCALDADALIARGRSLRAESPEGSFATSPTSRRCAALEEIERSRLLGAVRPPDQYQEWVAGAAAFKRALPDDADAAFQCYDTWSSQSTKYCDEEKTRRKFDQVPAEYNGSARPVTVEMLHWRARRRAEKVIRTVFATTAGSTLPPGRSDAGSAPPRRPDDVVPEVLTPEHGVVALTYLLVCWSKGVFDRATARVSIPEAALNEAERRAKDVRERIALAGRTLHTWSGGNLSADTRALADAVASATKDLYRVDGTLVRVVASAVAAERTRKIYGYEGRPGDPDPAQRAGHRLMPLLPTDSEALRELIAENIAAEIWTRDKSRSSAAPVKHIGSFAFKPSAKTHAEPDAGVLRDLLKRVLPPLVPEINGVVTAPVMPDLPRSTQPDDLLQPEADRILTKPGFDAASGLYLSPVGDIVSVPQTPTRAEVDAATALILQPLADFPFVSPGEGLDADVSLSAVVYAMLLAANRRALSVAPGLAIGSHGEGMSSGKTLAGEVVCTLATGDLPRPVSLSPNFTEQRKEIITYLLEGDGALFLDNVPNGTRFDCACLASAMTSPRFKGRLLGANKEIECSTRAMVVATGTAINLAGDLASRFLSARLDTGLERPEDRSSSTFQIPDLRQWVVDNRQRMVAAVHTIVAAYVQECRLLGSTPARVVARRAVGGSRFGGPCDVLRDALLWAFPELPDPFLSFQASSTNSSTKAEAALVLSLLDRWMSLTAGDKCAPAWATRIPPLAQSPERARWSPKFRARWSGLTPDQQRVIYNTNDMNTAENDCWQRVCTAIRLRLGRNAVRTGRSRFTGAEIVAALGHQPEGDTLCAAMHADRLNAVALGRWLKERLVDAPLDGLVLRSAPRRDKTAEYWITWGRLA
jgi:hypothetical protein